MQRVTQCINGSVPAQDKKRPGKLKWQYKVRNRPKKRLPVIVGRAVWENVTKGCAGVRWDSIVEKVWKDT